MAAYARFGGPTVVVDFGTAVTWEVVSEAGEYLGGVIAPGYSDEAGSEHLPVGVAPAALSVEPLAVVALDIPEKVRVLRVIAQAESGADGYAAINADTEYNDPRHPAYHKYHIGLSWGFIQFTQRSGELGKVLRAIKAREDAPGSAIPEPQRFAALFGPSWQELLRVTTAGDEESRVQAVGGANLWEPAWTARFRAAGAVPHVRAAQNEIAIHDFLDPAVRLARWLGLNTARGIAMLVDRFIHMGAGGGLRWVMQTVGPVRNQGDLEAALRAVGAADVRAFQRTQAPDLAADGQWGPRTHAALTGALRALGSGSPLPVASPPDMLRRLCEAARGTRFETRVRRLYENRTEFDDASTYNLG